MLIIQFFFNDLINIINKSFIIKYISILFIKKIIYMFLMIVGIYIAYISACNMFSLYTNYFPSIN